MNLTTTLCLPVTPMKSTTIPSYDLAPVRGTSLSFEYLKMIYHSKFLIIYKSILQSNPKEPRDLLVLKCDNWCILQCKRINDETIEENVCTSFTLLPALEDGYFSDVELVSANNKQVIIVTLIW